jgi:hypothetical protein
MSRSQPTWDWGAAATKPIWPTPSVASGTPDAKLRRLRRLARPRRLGRKWSSRRHPRRPFRQQPAKRHVLGRHCSRRPQSGKRWSRPQRLIPRIEPLAIKHDPLASNFGFGRGLRANLSTKKRAPSPRPLLRFAEMPKIGQSASLCEVTPDGLGCVPKTDSVSHSRCQDCSIRGKRQCSCFMRFPDELNVPS